MKKGTRWCQFSCLLILVFLVGCSPALPTSACKNSANIKKILSCATSARKKIFFQKKIAKKYELLIYFLTLLNKIKQK